MKPVKVQLDESHALFVINTGPRVAIEIREVGGRLLVRLAVKHAAAMDIIKALATAAAEAAYSNSGTGKVTV